MSRPAPVCRNRKRPAPQRARRYWPHGQTRIRQQRRRQQVDHGRWRSCQPVRAPTCRHACWRMTHGWGSSCMLQVILLCLLTTPVQTESDKYANGRKRLFYAAFGEVRGAGGGLAPRPL